MIKCMPTIFKLVIFATLLLLKFKLYPANDLGSNIILFLLIVMIIIYFVKSVRDGEFDQFDHEFMHSLVKIFSIPGTKRTDVVDDVADTTNTTDITDTTIKHPEIEETPPTVDYVLLDEKYTNVKHNCRISKPVDPVPFSDEHSSDINYVLFDETKKTKPANQSPAVDYLMQTIETYVNQTQTPDI